MCLPIGLSVKRISLPRQVSFGLLGSLLAVLLCLALPGLVHAVDESIPCTGEPTNMGIAVGHVISCSIDVIGDSDLFQFYGRSGQHVIFNVFRRSGGGPCVSIARPDATFVVPEVCSVVGVTAASCSIRRASTRSRSASSATTAPWTTR